jgi:hypothetical protein
VNRGVPIGIEIESLEARKRFFLEKEAKTLGLA